jgi:hypothetical protein
MITIYGASDDLVEVEGCEGADQFYVLGSAKEGEVCWRANLVGPGATEQMAVGAIYNGCWHLVVGQPLEDVLFPEWPLTITQHESGYSVLLSIDAPAGTRLDDVWPKAED